MTPSPVLDWTPPDPDSPAAPNGWVLYDAVCGFCSWWIPYWKPTIRRAGFDVAPLQSAFARRHTGRAGADVNRDILLLLRDGTLVTGADAYIYGMRQIWWSQPFGFLLGLPGLRQLTWIFYRWFSRNRFFVSRVCGLPPEGVDRVVRNTSSGVVTLREVSDEEGTRTLWASLSPDGDIVIQGRDYGDGVERVLGAREYEWGWTIHASQIPVLLRALDATGDVLSALASRFSGERAANLGQFLNDKGIVTERWSRQGD